MAAPRRRAPRAVDDAPHVRFPPPVVDSSSADWSDSRLIETWQQVRKAMGSVDGRVACALSTADAPGALVHEALAAMAATPDGMLPMSQLAEVLGLSTGGCTKLVDRLVVGGFARRHHSSTDRRVVFAALTDDGAVHEEGSTAAYAQQLRIELGVLGPDRLVQLQEIAMTLRGWASPAFADSDATHGEMTVGQGGPTPGSPVDLMGGARQAVGPTSG